MAAKSVAILTCYSVTLNIQDYFSKNLKSVADKEWEGEFWDLFWWGDASARCRSRWRSLAMLVERSAASSYCGSGDSEGGGAPALGGHGCGGHGGALIGVLQKVTTTQVPLMLCDVQVVIIWHPTAHNVFVSSSSTSPTAGYNPLLVCGILPRSCASNLLLL